MDYSVAALTRLRPQQTCWSTRLIGACTGWWWAGRRELGRFQLHRQKGAKNAKKEESESFLKQKVKRLCKKEQQDVGNLA